MASVTGELLEAHILETVLTHGFSQTQEKTSEINFLFECFNYLPNLMISAQVPQKNTL